VYQIKPRHARLDEHRLDNKRKRSTKWRDQPRRLPDIRAPAAEAEGLEAHRLKGDVTGEDQVVGPGDLAAVFLLDQPQ
jgi:hypothetical protein